jgi:hypothetical protein
VQERDSNWMIFQGYNFMTLNPNGVVVSKLRGFSPQANYTDRATAACWRSGSVDADIDKVGWCKDRSISDSVGNDK